MSARGELQSIGAVSEAATELIALGALYYAKRAFDRQNEQLTGAQRFEQEQSKVLALQADELRESLSERRRAQAIWVSLSVVLGDVMRTSEKDEFGNDLWTFQLNVDLLNASTLPIFDIKFFVGIAGFQVDGAINYDGKTIAQLLAGGRVSPYQRMSRPYEMTGDKITVDVTFRDHGGRLWTVAPLGSLNLLADSPRHRAV